MNERSALIAITTLLAAGCLSACSIVETKCTDDSPRKDVTITYGDSHLSVDSKEKGVDRDDYLVFKLKPDPGKGPPPRTVDFSKVDVSIAGKDAAARWVSAAGSDASSGGQLVVCVPTKQALGTYEYLIKVDKVGSLDPRVIVEK